jgi:uncharacterized protein (UPF0332 family)
VNIRDCFKEGLLRKAAPSLEMAQKEIDNSGKYLADAKRCLQEGMPEMAVVAVYTSMFHASRALLFRDGLRERSHICVIAYLVENYPDLKPHIRTLDLYRRSRHMMLYGVDVSAVTEDARQGILAAGQFQKAVETELAKPPHPGPRK